MKKKILSIVLSLAMILSMATMFIGTVSATEADLEIADYTDLENFIASLATESYAGKLVVLTDDIVVNDGWVANDGTSEAVAAPTGEYAEILDTAAAVTAFAGTFDGGNYTISGLYMTGNGFFPTINGATIKNVTFDNCASTSKLYGTETKKYCAGIVAGQILGGAVSLENVVVENSKIVNGTSAGYMGMFVGRIEASNGTVNFNNCSSVDCYLVSGANTSLLGGLVGSFNAVTGEGGNYFRNCYNSSTIIASGTNNNGYKLGGIIGSTGSNMTLLNCVNEGDITSQTFAGGMIGDVGTNPVTVTGCVNRGDIAATTISTGDAGAGGMLGRNNNTSIVITDCVNFGEIVATTSGTGSNIHAGGMVGYGSTKALAKAEKIENCMNQGTLYSDKQAGGVFGKMSGLLDISGFVNTGDITAMERAGGLIGVYGGKKGTVEKIITVGVLSGYAGEATVNSGASCAAFGQWVQENGTDEVEVIDFFYSNNGVKNVFGLWKSLGSEYDNYKASYTATGAYKDFVPGVDNVGEGNNTTNLGFYNEFFIQNGYKADASDFYGEKGANIFKAFNLGVDWMLTDTVPVPAGVFALMEGKEIVEASVDYVGYQANAGEELNSIRVVAGLNSTADFSNTGFELYLIANGKDALMLDKSTTTVYTALNVYDADGNALEPYQASEAGYSFLSAITVNFDDLSVMGDVTTLIVKPYVTVNGEKIYGSSCAIVIEKNTNALTIADQYVM